MLGQSKNVFQAEIDAACELIDFLRFNPYFMKKIHDISITLGLRKRQKNRRRFSRTPERRRTANLEE